MSNDLNQCQFIGRLGRDPEIRYSPNGDPIASFSIGVSWKSKNGEGTEWVRIVAFGKLAEICGQWLKKGQQVYISGRWKTSEYEKNGEKRYSTQIMADRMQMLGSRQDGGGGGGSQHQSQGNTYGAGGGQQNNQSQNYEADFDGDIPF